ncbi:hypothetical protein CBR_g55951 [Chara braunii]|uniref:Pectinesterase n=1 Tax=Chara braunii TaxID=69332 RepID=A0A388MDB8_CHABU|nr:hypothetical protein CBR_g55951 [Chara braunii]|eukprot:GBG92557.1 hypothetical protein CBR_g55951 [Chara braunii]
MAPTGRGWLAGAMLALLSMAAVASATEDPACGGLPFAAGVCSGKGGEADLVTPNTGTLKATEKVGAQPLPPVAVGFQDANGNDRSSGRKGDVVVAQDGSGNFRTVQAAINAAPVKSTKRFVIFIKPGRYTEKVTVPSNKPFITLRGSGPYRTVISWGDRASTLLKTTKKPMGTFLSASVGVNADYFTAEDITFQNHASRPRPNSFTEQAVAFRITGDFAAFHNVRFYGYQDTLYCHRGRHLFKNVYVRGSVDFIFGNGRSMFLDSLLFADVTKTGGALTAQKRDSTKEPTGFVFIRCKVQGTGQVYLGRAWGRAARTIFAYTYMDNVILPVGWNDWFDPTRQETIFYAEYRCSGPGARRGQRARWSFGLTDKQVQPFLSTNFIDGKKWLGKTGIPGLSDLGTKQSGTMPTNAPPPPQNPKRLRLFM